jgi:hypothetical protein
LSGLRAQVKRPTPMKPQPITRPSTTTAPRRFAWSLVRIRTASTIPKMNPARPSPQRALRSDLRAAPPARRRRARPLE